MATKKTNKPKASNLTQQVATRMDVASFARLLAQTLGNDRWFTDEVIEKTFKQSGAPGNKLGKDTSKATKIPLIKSEDRVMTSLMAIHNLLKTSYEDKLKSLEEHNQFKEEYDIEKKKQNDEFLEAIKGLNGAAAGNAPTATKVKEENDNPSLLGDMLGVLSDLKSVAGILFKVGRFFMFNPIGIALLAGATLLSLLAIDKNPEATTKGMLAAGDVGEANKQMMDVVENTGGAEKRKLKILSERPSSKKSMLFWKDSDLGKKYLEEVGFDEKTGLTTAEKELGYRGVDNDGNLITTPPKSEGTPAPADSTTNTPTVPPTASESTSSTPTVPPAASESTSGTTTNNTEASTTISPNMSTNISSAGDNSLTQKFNAVNSENLEMKLPQEPSQRGTTVTNIQKNQQRGESSSLPIPGVRNNEPTFQRMILNSTRVV